jgi:hypothetical protein
LAFEAGSRLSILGESAFESCSSLRSIWIPSRIETIPGSCFSHCMGLRSLTFEPDSHVSLIGWYAFKWWSSLESVWLPSSVETIATSCFTECWRLRSLVAEAGSRLRCRTTVVPSGGRNFSETEPSLCCAHSELGGSAW